MAILCIGTVHADNHPAPGKFGVTAEFLYFMPSIDDTYFAFAGTRPTVVTDPQVTRLNNDFNYKPGYRVGAVYAFCACERSVEATYTHLNGSQNRTVTGTVLSGTLGSADFLSQFENFSGSATSNLNAKYDRVDGLFSQSIFDCCKTNIHVLIGLEWANLRMNENYTYSAATLVGINNLSSRTWGVGPEFGFEIDYGLYECQGCLPGALSLVVKSTGSLLSSETKTTVSTFTTPAQGAVAVYSNLNDEKGWRVIPALHTRIGLGFTTTICRMASSLEIGYEYSSYIRGYARTTQPDDVADALYITNYNNYDLQGLYVSASVSF